MRNLADSYIQQHGVAPLDWIGTQMRKQVEYNADALFEAALRWMPTLLRLDTSFVDTFVIHNVVEKRDKKTGEISYELPERFKLPVTVSLKPTVTISTGKLSKLMEDKSEQ